MTVAEMEAAVAAGSKEESPSGFLHEVDPAEMTALDDVSGQELDPALMMQARRDEIRYFREMGVYDKVDIAESWKSRFDFISSSNRISFFESTRTPTISLSSMQPR